ncbi:MAG: glutathione S-transferase family protein [Alphaproteobacteria bacterium]|nr:glutathione S-transferase family protein [Alphaproteobacteria bacterium SS10]
MGLLIDGEWADQWYDTKKSGGRFERQESAFRSWITADGSPGPTGEGGFKAEADRYHLYVSLACPWAHRTLIMRALKGLNELISMSAVHWYMGDKGWSFEAGDGVIPDPIHGAQYLHQVYQAADPKFTGRVTTPTLWDRETRTIVSNESADIIRMLNSAFDTAGAVPGDYYPPHLREQIDPVNERIYQTLNNGVYKAGFATSQAAYDEAIEPLFETMEWLEERLAQQRYLVGNRVTEADWRLFVTLLRFDAVYVTHFKCTRARLVDYPNLWAYTRELFQWPGVAETVNMDHIRRHYYESHPSINPHGIVPVMPDISFDTPHGRSALGPTELVA